LKLDSKEFEMKLSNKLKEEIMANKARLDEDIKK
jgi:hypothetical protein